MARGAAHPVGARRERAAAAGCRGSAAVRVPPLTLPDRYRHDLESAIAFSGLSHDFFTRAKAEELLWVVRRHLGDPAGLDALDVGCGIGLTDRHLAGRFQSLTGTDVSREALEAASRTNPDVRYELGGADRLPFGDAAFDVTFAVNVVQVVPRDAQGALVAELARVTRRGGLAVIFEHNPYNPLTRLVVRRWPERTFLLSAGAIRRLMRGAGLEPVTSGHLLLFPSRRRRLLAVERAIRRLPLGAQLYVAGRPG